MKKNYHLVVSGFGTVYIATLLKQVGVMGSDRRQVPETEFLVAIEEYTKCKLKDGHNTLEIKNSKGDVVMDIKIYPNRPATKEVKRKIK